MLGADFEAVSMPIDLTGNRSTAVISIPIVNDNLAEGYETFGGKLEVMSQSLNLSYFESEIRIEIVDDEGSLTYCDSFLIDYLYTYFVNQVTKFVGICLQEANAVLMLFVESAQMEEAY